MNSKDEKTASLLRTLGLSDKEAAIYLATLELGKSTVSRIGRRTGVNRTTVYAVLDSLAGKGLVSISGREPKEEYVAESPDKLVTYLKEKLADAEHRTGAVKAGIMRAEELLPHLKSIHKVGDRPRVRFYDGKDGLKQVYDDTLAQAGEDGIRSFGSYEDMAGSLGPQYGGYVKKRVAKGIHGRGIYPKTAASLERKRHDTEELRELALFPEDTRESYPEIDIYGDRVMIASAREELGIIIESAEIAAAMKKLFDIAWERMKQLEAK